MLEFTRPSTSGRTCLNLSYTEKDRDRLYFVFYCKVINPAAKPIMLDWGRYAYDWDDDAAAKYSEPKIVDQGGQARRELEVRLHLGKKVQVEGARLTYFAEDIIEMCEEILKKAGYELIEK